MSTMTMAERAGEKVIFVDEVWIVLAPVMLPLVRSKPDGVSTQKL